MIIQPQPRPQYGVDLFRLEGGGRTLVGSYPTEAAAKRSARLDIFALGSRRYVLIGRGGDFTVEGFTCPAGSHGDFVVTYDSRANTDPEPPAVILPFTPAEGNRIAWALQRLGRREAA